jgi:hypothetical protein
MNRQQRRRAHVQHLCLDDIFDHADIVVVPKFHPVVMIYANAKGRKVAEDLFPDVEWARDALFANGTPPDWQFTHVRVTKLPPHLEEVAPLSDAVPDSVGLAVAVALQRVMTGPPRVANWVGQGAKSQLQFHDIPETFPIQEMARSLFAEYVPPVLDVRGTA